MASFIENLRNALANRLEKGQSNIVHMNPKNAPSSYSTVRLRENDGDPGTFPFKDPYSGQYNSPSESLKAYDSLRRGETVSTGKDAEGDIKGGIYGTRFLGNNPNDFMSPEYFSDNAVSDKYAPRSVRISGGKFSQEDSPEKIMRAFYDDRGAIARIEVSRDGWNGTEIPMERIDGAKNISNYFKSLGWDSGEYTVYGKNLSEYIPTTLLGSGAKDEPVSESGSMRWTLKNRKNKKSFDEYYKRYQAGK